MAQFDKNNSWKIIAKELFSTTLPEHANKTISNWTYMFASNVQMIKQSPLVLL